MVRIYIDGNIASGKSTLGEFIEHNIANVKIYPEPVAEWSHRIDGESLFSIYNKDRTRWSYTFQSSVIISKYLAIKSQPTDVINLMIERSFEADWVFAKMLFDSGQMTSIEWHMYNTLFDMLNKQSEVKYIYLAIDPATCYSRYCTRARDGESVTIDYITTLNDLNLKYLTKRPNTLILDQRQLDDIYSGNTTELCKFISSS
jgi:deoxyadenosine/deoxycytidine kinase